jgi:hypothetical protein
MAAARALLSHTELSAREIAIEAMQIAADLCIFTNDVIEVASLPEPHIGAETEIADDSTAALEQST